MVEFTRIFLVLMAIGLVSPFLMIGAWFLIVLAPLITIGVALFAFPLMLTWMAIDRIRTREVSQIDHSLVLVKNARELAVIPGWSLPVSVRPRLYFGDTFRRVFEKVDERSDIFETSQRLASILQYKKLLETKAGPEGELREEEESFIQFEKKSVEEVFLLGSFIK